MSRLAINCHLFDKEVSIISKNIINIKKVKGLSTKSNYSTTKPKMLRKVNERRD